MSRCICLDNLEFIDNLLRLSHLDNRINFSLIYHSILFDILAVAQSWFMHMLMCCVVLLPCNIVLFISRHCICQLLSSCIYANRQLKINNESVKGAENAGDDNLVWVPCVFDSVNLCSLCVACVCDGPVVCVAFK